MKAIKTLPRFRCDFCKRTGIKSAIARHEIRCFRNPNRFCDYCENKGFTKEHLAGDGITETAYYQDTPCPYCTKRDPEIEKGIAEYEASKKEHPIPDEASL